MDFLFNYGLFLAKAVTIVVALLVIVGFIVSTAHRGGGKDKGHIKVTRLNDRFEEMHHILQAAVLEEKDLKEIDKKKKK